MIEMETWGEPETDLDWIQPGKESCKKIFRQKVKDSFRLIVSIIMSIIGLAIIVLIFIAYSNPPKETVIEKMKTELDLQLDQMQTEKANK